jgi:flap endonuclease-1
LNQRNDWYNKGISLAPSFPTALVFLPIKVLQILIKTMGIKSLSKVIADNAPEAMNSNEIKNLFGRKVAIDASMSLYQFLIAVRSQDGMNLQNENGDTTSHLMGMFYRTIRMVENGIKPCYVFDGSPPKLKSEEVNHY